MRLRLPKGNARPGIISIRISNLRRLRIVAIRNGSLRLRSVIISLPSGSLQLRSGSRPLLSGSLQLHSGSLQLRSGSLQIRSSSLSRSGILSRSGSRSGSVASSGPGARLCTKSLSCALSDHLLLDCCFQSRQPWPLVSFINSGNLILA